MADATSEEPERQAPEPHLRPRTRRIREDIESDGVRERNRAGRGLFTPEERHYIREYEEIHPPRRAIWQIAVNMKTEPTEWAWPGRVPLGTLTVLEGDPDVGKTTIACTLAAAFTRAKKLPDWQDDAIWGLDYPVHVGYITGEDRPEESLLPRFLTAGGDPNLMHFFDYIEQPEIQGYSQDQLSLPTDLPALRDSIVQNGLRVVIIDVLSSFIDQSIDTHSDASFRRLLTPLCRLATEMRVAMIAMRHLTKNHGGKAIYAGQGSIAYGGAARSVLVVAQHPENESKNVLAVTKGNSAPKEWKSTIEFENVSAPFTYSEGITQTAAKIEWGDTVDLSADDVTSTEKKSQKERASDWLLEYLTPGVGVLASSVFDAGKQFSQGTLHRAAKDLGVEKYKEGNVWWWRLP